MSEPEGKSACAMGYQCDIAKGIEGMTLRDWFAGMAMQGLCACPNVNEGWKEISRIAYGYADSMFRQRTSCHTADAKEFWVVVSAQGKPLSVHTTKPTDNGFNCIKVREVVE